MAWLIHDSQEAVAVATHQWREPHTDIYKVYVMSAVSQPLVYSASHAFRLSASLSDRQQQDAASLLRLLSAKADTAGNVQTDNPVLDIRGFVDGRGLACPMPLLKTKVALRDVAKGEALYVVATDPNSQADITAFCKQGQQANGTEPLTVSINEVTDAQPVDGTSLQRFATIYHFIITKNDSN